MKPVKRWWKRVRAVVFKDSIERELDREMQLHLELETQKNIREGMTAEEAKRQAHITFGGVERYKQQTREARAFDWIGGMSLDMKLGVRMMLKHPALAIVGGIGMAIAIAIGSASFTIVRSLTTAWLPEDGAERIVTLRNDDARTGERLTQTHLHDLVTWRRALTSVEELGAYRVLDRNMVVPNRGIEPVRVVELTASALHINRASALMGRGFDEADERAGAPPVVLLGYGMWRDEFDADPSIVGKSVALGGVEHAIVGVMREGFAFPVNHSVWTPLRLNPLDYPQGNAPAVAVVARLRPSATLEQASAELSAAVQTLAESDAAVHANVRSRVIPFAMTEFDDPAEILLLYLFQVFVSSILVIIGINVAILVYARTANRIGEIAIRTALGGSRKRVVLQLFCEALVLSSIAAVFGLGAAQYTLRSIHRYLTFIGGDEMPYWWTFRLDWIAIAYVAGLALFSSVIVGVLPALKATGKRVQSTLQQVSTKGSGLLLGRTWTFLIVAQVAIAVIVLPFALSNLSGALSSRVDQNEYATSGFLTATLALNRQGDDATPESDESFAARYATLQSEVVRRLEADPAVAEVVRTDGPPLSAFNASVEEDETQPEAGVPPTERHNTLFTITGLMAGTFLPGNGGVAFARIDTNFFRAFGVPILSGRDFRAEDRGPESNAVIVNRRFIVDVLGGGEPLGRRIKVERRGCPEDPAAAQAAACDAWSGPWLEIVGVVPDFPSSYGLNAPVGTYYRPMPEGGFYPLTLNVRVRGVAPEAFTGRLREIALAVDPDLSVTGAARLDDAMEDNSAGLKILSWISMLLPMSVLLLSAAGIAALMSFTVVQRRREIGIRLALGAGGRHVLGSVLRRAALQIGAGILVGVAIISLLLYQTAELNLEGAQLLASIVAVVGAVGFAATLGPVRSGMRIQPTEALKGE